MTLSFPTEKSFYKADNLFKHDFLLRRSFDAVDLLWYRTHDPIDGDSEQRLKGLDEADLSKIERTVENCPDNEIESSFQQVLNQLIELQCETEIYDFYYEFHYSDIVEIVKDDHLIQRMSDIVQDLRVVESEELSSDYEKFWDHVYEKIALKAIISPEVWDNNSSSNAHSFKKTNTKSKVLSDASDVTISRGREVIKQMKPDEASLMNARFLLQQLKDRGLDDDRLTYVNIFAEEDDEEDVEAEYSSSGTLSTELEATNSLEASGSKLTEISFEKDSPMESETSIKDPFKDRSFDTLYYVVRLIYEHLQASSDMYFSEAPIILLENDLVLEMKERELKYLTHYSKILNQSLVKTVELSNEGLSSRAFRHGLLMMTDELVSQMEKVRQEGVATNKDTRKYSEFTYSIMRAPKVERSDYRKLVNFDMKTEEIKSIGQKRKIKHFKTMVCLAGRTKLRRYDFSEKVTGELNKIRFPIQRIANLTKTAREHATLTVNGYLETLVKLTKKRMFYEDYPDDLYRKMHDTLNKTNSVIKDVEEMKKTCADANAELAKKAIYKPLGRVRIAGKNDGVLDINSIRQPKSETGSATQISNSETSNDRCYTSGLNLILKKIDRTFEKTVMPSKVEKTNKIDEDLTSNKDCFESHGFPRLFSHSGLRKRSELMTESQ